MNHCSVRKSDWAWIAEGGDQLPSADGLRDECPVPHSHTALQVLWEGDLRSPLHVQLSRLLLGCPAK